MLIFEKSGIGRKISSQYHANIPRINDIPEKYLRKKPPLLPEVSEMQVVRHYTRLSQQNFSIDTHFYPLGSCTMKYNPRICNTLAQLPGLLSHHPATPASHSQGVLACLYELQEILTEITGMKAVSLTPAAGSQGEFAGVAMIRAYHDARGDTNRTEILIPDAAHGTNPASAVMCGYKVREIPTCKTGDVDFKALQTMIGPQTAGIMLTNPSTLGVFERQIMEIAQSVHKVGGLLYYDGANLNAILGKVRPGDMNFDVIHINLHKTFSTPHGGGGPGAGPVGVNERLLPFLPVPIVAYNDKHYHWLTEKDCPQTIGRMLAHQGNIGILIRAYIYIRLLGREGISRVAEFSTLNANYLQACLVKAGFDIAFPIRRASHEFILTLKKQAKQQHITTMDVAKRLLDKGFHAPTTYFPILIPECLLIEPTETEDKQTLDDFIAAMCEIQKEADDNPTELKQAPYHLPVRRLNEVKAARELNIIWQPNQKMAD
ncbi:MAG: aminomethyl-transferring glycine dehydrogenase subunit GcvPB [Thiomargarita sp.]|nr:aminomethyl-transferring glycine dehydrogenase subunit GcvPB [Thiomargarita sp.]